MSSCGQNCLIFSHTQQQDQQQDQEFMVPPLLVRTVHNLCITCATNNTSEYSHHFCYRCALPNTREFLYHHTRCPSPVGAAAEQT